MTKEQFFSALWRFIRVVIAQAIAFWATETAGINIPWVGISVGAAINMIAKILRDRFGWDWLIV